MRNYFIALGLAAGTAALAAGGPAHATPGQSATSAHAASASAVQQVDFVDRAERRLRRNGYTVIPPAPPGTAPVIVGTGPAVAVPPGAAVVPVRPTTCGEYHYWNGIACVDARYEETP
ncbi:hypothetical protein A7A08_00631 [Methyloligella halotolerans]|uniref:Uncharacterized protein n=1 Tax=Methyloligella halotolerans TaxID=1177755 RepID=A0A1E2S2T0_9HYPH|nr:hypothetical protein [Methyloligella halotolerans]ODA68797.1 hypothetical protein A7A08_00631 [Methyloligella halotolerans]